MTLLFGRSGGCCCPPPPVPTPRPFPIIIRRFIPALIIGALLIALGVFLFISPFVTIALVILGLILFLIGRIIFGL